MPVYDGGRYLAEAIESVLAQSLRDFELLILDDGSADDSAAIADRWAARDSRVRVHRFEHRGLVATLNDGLALARGEYVARADADDVCLPRRLAVQCCYMDRNPGVGIAGASMRVIDGYEWRVSVDWEVIRCELLFGVAMPHGSLVLRRSWLVESRLEYDLTFAHAEDFDLLERASRQTKLGNVAEILYAYRSHPAQVSRVHAEAQALQTRRIQARQLERLGVSFTGADLDLHQQIAARSLRAGVPVAAAWLERLIAANARARLYSPAALRRVLAERLYGACMGAPSIRPWTFLSFRRSGVDVEICGSARRSVQMLVRGCLPEAATRRAVRLLDKRRTVDRRLDAEPVQLRAYRHLLHHGELDAREFYVLHDRCVVFLVVSKVACTSIKVAMASAYGLAVDDPHAIHDPALWRRRIPSFEHAIGRYPAACSGYFKFAFVRNPLDRLVSCYVDRVARRGSANCPATLAFPGYPLVPAGISFRRFAHLVALIPDRLADRHFRGQVSSTHRRGEPLVDFIGRFESLQRDWRRVAERCDFPPELPRVNARAADGSSYRDHYSKSTLQVVHRRYAADFARLGYEDAYAELRDSLDDPGDGRRRSL